MKECTEICLNACLFVNVLLVGMLRNLPPNQCNVEFECVKSNHVKVMIFVFCGRSDEKGLILSFSKLS